MPPSHPNPCLHALFEQRAVATPDADAVTFDGEALSYAELNARANRLAHHLAERGARPDALVAVCLERGHDLPIALLGVLKSGAGYLPLEPGTPAERLAGVLADSGAVLLVTTEAKRAALGHAPEASVCLDTQADAIAACSGANPAPNTEPHHLAYAIYTSGTTGKPKGVLVEHAAIVNHARAAAELFALTPEDRVLQFSAIGFDVAAEEFYPTWLAGACVVLRDERATGSVADFARFVEAQRVTVLNLPGSWWHELVDELERGAIAWPDSVRLVLTGSERVRCDRYEAWSRLVGERVRWLSGYGPTETTVSASFFEPSSGWSPGELPSIPIGRPLAGVTFHIVDEEGRPVPDGEPGELLIGGAGVARGYLERPELTGERFIPDTFSDAPGARLYKTGDLVRALSDGNLLFLERVDSQVKLRGFRIELGEIESALRSHPSVRDCAVDAREDEPGRAFLAAYLVGADGEPATASALREHLRGALPDYMIPATWTTLDALPRLPNGKLDRRALPVPEHGRDEAAGEYVAPATETEQELASLWSELLGVERIGTADDFFALGGHSLLGTRLVAELRERRGCELSLVDLFERPTIAGLAALIDGESGSSRARERPPIGRASREGDLPLAFAQEPVWFLTQLEPDNLAYNTQLAVRLHGPLDHAAMQRALTALVARHEIFRTTFNGVQGKPVQRIHPTFEVELPLVDLSDHPADTREEECERLVSAECRRTFDVAALPLARWTIISLSETEHVLVQVEHHFVHDGWSIAILLGDIFELYGAEVEGRAPALEPAEIQYLDYVMWQREWIQGEALEELLGYWREHLDGAPPLLELPTDRPRPTLQTYVGNTQTLDMPGELYDRVAVFARERGLTPFMVMMAVWQALLSRMSGQADFAVATTVANRQRAELEGLIGMLVNTLVLRADLTGEPRFDELLQRVRRSALGAYAHQDLPFELLVQELAPRRDFSHNPLFQVMFSFHDAPVPDLSGGGLTGEIDYRHNGSAKFDMNVVVLARREQRVGRKREADREIVTIELEYNTDLFDHETITGMLDHYRVLLEDAIAHPERPVHELEMLTPDERTALLETWNDTGADWPDDRCVHDLVFARAEERPDAPAVGCDGATLSYGELATRSRALAGRLGALGVGPDDRVAVCLHRSTDMLVALLGTLASGAAYVPMDPDHPRARLEHQLGDAKVATLISSAGAADGLDVGAAHVIRLDEPIEGEEATTLPAVDPGSAAYVIYTSGSTGVPKGVVVPHRALVNFLRSMERVTGLTERDVLLAVTTISFDIAGLELYLPLLLGGRVEIATREQVADGRELVARLSSCGATVMQATPATWRLALTAGWEGDAQLLALCGGEALPADLAQELRDRCRTLINLYGPTETTIWSAFHDVGDGEDPVPIGRPIHNTTIHVLDAHGGLQPPRLPGEIAIGGAGVAIGYLDRPELTDERFVTDPFDSRDGARLYRTGDLGRRRADGTLEFLTRLDSQVKLRGFRIELGEIETLLRELPGVSDCAAGVVEYGPGDHRMVAWVVLADGAELEAEAWRTALGERLPEYMLPSTWVPTEALPLTPNGKLDRKALPRPEALAPARAPEDGPPTTAMECSLAEIWRDVLGASHVSVFDNFFDLGGHSLLTVQVAARVETEHGVHLTPRDLMLQNLGQLAAVCEERMGRTQGSEPVESAGDGLAARLMKGLRGIVGTRPPDAD